MSDRVEALLRMYDEHAKQARQHEDQRERMTNLILIVAGALITFISYNGLKADSLIASIALIILGAYGYLFSLKHYERNRYHTTIMKAFRDGIDQELGSPSSIIARLRNSGAEKHKENEAVYDKHMKERLRNIRLFRLWAGLPLLVAVFGLVLSALILVNFLANLQWSTPF
jgi:hypothetical protein